MLPTKTHWDIVVHDPAQTDVRHAMRSWRCYSSEEANRVWASAKAYPRRRLVQTDVQRSPVYNEDGLMIQVIEQAAQTILSDI